ncbi:MAG: ChaN family lipoprotein [Desulfarculaceae bacterium]|nr:ChaN family lipoprotein [Desulfarculaceae bacterium]MCF8072338.1 ChaN family lipoprotein [Desulfarculaceae bacterium]MCF8100259.1 ChaN family lipoprotein [Desulfarculaceae bacterium]MCF8116168.1 ChaN family lipoprotein [Desulfarculaceae bacterium]
MSRLKASLLLLALAGMGLATGCAGLETAPAAAPAYKPGDFLAPPEPKPLSEQQLAKRLEGAQVVLVGERHDHPGHHRLQVEMLKRLEAEGPVVVGVEWLEQTAQPACDRLSAGKITVDEFRKEVDWDQAWSQPWKMFAPLFTRVRAQGHTLVALNAPLKIVRQVAKNGLGSLSPEQRAAIAPSLNLDDPDYRAKVARQFAFHGVKNPQAQENFFAAQVVRDETMAHNLAQRLHPWPDGGKRALVLAGNGHLAAGLGLPPRISRRLPGVKLVGVMPLSPRAARFMVSAPGAPPADLLAVSTPGPRRPPRLGVFLKVKPGGLEVVRIFPNSPAAKAGLKTGDLLLSVDGKALTSPKGIHDAIKTSPHQPHLYRVKRGERELELSISLPRAGGKP